MISYVIGHVHSSRTASLCFDDSDLCELGLCRTGRNGRDLASDQASIDSRHTMTEKAPAERRKRNQIKTVDFDRRMHYSIKI
jgi:hypothetical protein